MVYKPGDTRGLSERRSDKAYIRDLVGHIVQNPADFTALRELASLYSSRKTTEPIITLYGPKNKTVESKLTEYDLKNFFYATLQRLNREFTKDKLVDIIIESMEKNNFFWNLEDINRVINNLLGIAPPGYVAPIEKIIEKDGNEDN